MTKQELIMEAFLARKQAYAPYSKFKVGAALLCESGTVFRGCNVENASYGATMCAERTALFSAVASGERRLEMIAIVGGNEFEFNEVNGYAYPCGMCRQALSEFCKPDMPVIVARSEEDYKEFTMKELLPEAFTL